MALSRTRPISLLLFALCLLCWSAFACLADEPAQVQVPQIDSPPLIDGQFDDPCWAQAPALNDFYCLEVEQTVPEATEVRVCADKRALYFAVTCYDRTPEDVIASETRRGGNLEKDDYIALRIDPWHRHGDIDNCYIFQVNPAGTQSEQIPGGSATKIEWRGDWQAATQRVPGGWQAEIAIPFSVLRYPAGQSTFGLAVTRRFARERLEACCPNVGKVFDPTRTADLTGLCPPTILEKRTVTMPYLTIDLGESVGKRFDMGFDVQHKLANGLTALASVNPDFKQIEDVVEPISFSYTERYLDDPRPFFTTGQDGFFPAFNLLYTRRIEDFDAGLKLFGKVGQETIGIFDAATLGEKNSFAGSWGHNFDDNTSARLSLVRHQSDGEPENLAYGLSGSRTWRKPEGYNSLWYSYYGSHDSEQSGNHYLIGGETYNGSGKFQGWGDIRLINRGFAPALGYNPDVNYYGASFGLGRFDRFETGALEERGWYLNCDYWRYLHGDGVLNARLNPTYTWTWRDGQRLRLGVTAGERENTANSDASVRYTWRNNDTFRRGSLFLLHGTRSGGNYNYASLEQGFRPTDCLSVYLNCEYSHLADPAPDAGSSYLAVITSNYDLTKEKSIAARLIANNDGFNAYASYRQVVRQGMDIYVILGDPDPDHTGLAKRIVVKLIWAL